MPARTATAVWKGDLAAGSGNVKVGSGAIDSSYSRISRFEDGSGTNPEELLGAAHAGCFSMALAARLSREGFAVESISTTAHVNLEKNESGFAIARIDLVTEGKVEGISPDQFAEAAAATKDGCIVSKALSAVPMTIVATLA